MRKNEAADDDIGADMDLWFAFHMREISLAQLRAQLMDRGWTAEEIEDALDEDDGDEDPTR
jgi:hypothetical protein